MAVLNKYAFGDRIPDGAVNIMRPTRWGNPFAITAGRDRDTVVEMYRAKLWEDIRSGRVPLADLAALHDKDLVCCCAPKRCHGHVLEQAAAWTAARLKT